MKKKIKSTFEDLDFEGTVEDLAAFILRFGDVCKCLAILLLSLVINFQTNCCFGSSLC